MFIILLLLHIPVFIKNIVCKKFIVFIENNWNNWMGIRVCIIVLANGIWKQHVHQKLKYFAGLPEFLLNLVCIGTWVNEIPLVITILTICTSYRAGFCTEEGNYQY